MTDKDWKWYSGSNDEEFHNGPFDAREDAVDALDGYGGYVIEAVKYDLRLSDLFQVSSFLEQAEDSVDDLYNEDYSLIFDTSEDQARDLQLLVRAAIDTWQDAHGLKFVPWVFKQSRNLQRIDADEVK